MFVGRKDILEDLESLWRKRTSSLVACRGRRRIGKSTLFREFARRSAEAYIEIEGLPPSEEKEMTNQDIVADIIAFIRQQAIGSSLISHEERVKRAFTKLREHHQFNKDQLNWLNRIEKTMLKEPVLDVQMFEQGAFKNAGGFINIDRRFNGQLGNIINELNQYLYDDGGSVA